MKVLNFGSLNIDYVYDVEHFVQKGETISSTALKVFSGGKGLNQSVAFSKAGADIYHAGMIGTDGTFLKEILKETGVKVDYVKQAETVRTGNAIIQNDRQGDNCIILYGGANQAISKKFVEEVFRRFESGDWLVIQNEINENPYIVECAHKKGMKVVLNPSPMNEKIFDINLKYVDCFILNEGEGKVLAGNDLQGEELLDELKKKFPHTTIVLTLGERGSVYADENNTVYQKAYKVKTVDTTAAGDTFTVYFISGRLQGMPVKQSLKLAAKASAITVTGKGAAPSIPWMEEVLKCDFE